MTLPSYFSIYFAFFFFFEGICCHSFFFFYSVWILLNQSVWLFNIFFHHPPHPLVLVCLLVVWHYREIPEVILQAFCNHTVRHCWRKWHSGSFCVHHHQCQIGIVQCSVVLVYSSSKYTVHYLQRFFTFFRSMCDFSKGLIFIW